MANCNGSSLSDGTIVSQDRGCKKVRKKILLLIFINALIVF